MKRLNQDEIKLFGWPISTPNVLLIFGVIGVLCLFAYYFGNEDVKLGELLLIALASLIFGGMGGFLFGIPKMAKKNDGQVRPNTNLEEISDWLTKIIVGLSLSQLPAIMSNASELVAAINKDIPSMPKSVIFALIIFFSIYGFFFSYLSTRIYLGLVFAMSDEKIAAARADVNNALQNIKDNVDHPVLS
jgi:hypothetical protein